MNKLDLPAMLLQNPGNLEARCEKKSSVRSSDYRCDNFIQKSKINYASFLQRHGHFPSSMGRKEKNYNVFLFVKGENEGLNLTMEDLPLLQQTLSKYLKQPKKNSQI